jgi:HEAT repeat protein
MRTHTIGDRPSEPELSQVEAKRRRRSGIRVRVIILALCVAMIAWSGFRVWENYHPMQAAARGLRSWSASQRVSAIRDLTQLSSSQSEEAIRFLTPALGDSDTGVRGAAADALGVVGPSAARSESEATRAAVMSLLGALKDPEAPVRIAAASALGNIATSASRTRSARGSAKSSKGAETPVSGIDLKAIAAALLDLMDDREAAVRQAAIGALRDVPTSVLGDPPQPLIAATEDESAMNRAMAISVLSNFPRGLDRLIPIVFRHMEHDEPMVRETCTQALSRIKPSALSASVVPTLIAGLKSPNADVRIRLIPLLARLSPDARTSVPALIAVLREPIGSDISTLTGTPPSTTYQGPAQEAAKALGRIAPGTPAAGEAIAALTEILRSGPPQRRAEAADALHEFGVAAAGAVPALITFLKEAAAIEFASDDGPSAARALGRLAPGSPSADAAVTALAAALKSGSGPTREAALTALSSFGPAAAGAIASIRALQENAPTPNIRKAAASALEKIAPASK